MTTALAIDTNVFPGASLVPLQLPSRRSTDDSLLATVRDVCVQSAEGTQLWAQLTRTSADVVAQDTSSANWDGCIYAATVRKINTSANASRSGNATQVDIQSPAFPEQCWQPRAPRTEFGRSPSPQEDEGNSSPSIEFLPLFENPNQSEQTSTDHGYRIPQPTPHSIDHVDGLQPRALMLSGETDPSVQQSELPVEKHSALENRGKVYGSPRSLAAFFTPLEMSTHSELLVYDRDLRAALTRSGNTSALTGYVGLLRKGGEVQVRHGEEDEKALAYLFDGLLLVVRGDFKSPPSLYKRSSFDVNIIHRVPLGDIVQMMPILEDHDSKHSYVLDTELKNGRSIRFVLSDLRDAVSWNVLIVRYATEWRTQAGREGTWEERNVAAFPAYIFAMNAWKWVPDQAYSASHTWTVPQTALNVTMLNDLGSVLYHSYVLSTDRIPSVFRACLFSNFLLFLARDDNHGLPQLVAHADLTKVTGMFDYSRVADTSDYSPASLTNDPKPRLCLITQHDAVFTRHQIEYTFEVEDYLRIPRWLWALEQTLPRVKFEIPATGPPLHHEDPAAASDRGAPSAQPVGTLWRAVTDEVSNPFESRSRSLYPPLTMPRPPTPLDRHLQWSTAAPLDPPESPLVGVVFLSTNIGGNPDEYNITVGVTQQLQSNGLGTFAIAHALRVAFEMLHAHRVQARILHSTVNGAAGSKAAAEAEQVAARAISKFLHLGFVHEGVRRRAVMHVEQGAWADVTVLALDDRDWFMRTHRAAPPKMSTWDEMFARHQRERETLLRPDSDGGLLKRTRSMETVRDLRAMNDAAASGSIFGDDVAMFDDTSTVAGTPSASEGDSMSSWDVASEAPSQVESLRGRLERWQLHQEPSADDAADEDASWDDLEFDDSDEADVDEGDDD